MIRNLDYWQPASNIVIVNNNNRGGAASTSTTNAADENGAPGSVNNSSSSDGATNGGIASCNNNNNEDGFGDKNGSSDGTKIAKIVAGSPRQSTVIVTMAHDKGEQIEVTGDGSLIEEEDLIDEEEAAEIVIEEDEQDTKGLDASLDGTIEVEVEQEEVVSVDFRQERNAKRSSSGSALTPNTSSSTNSSFEEPASVSQISSTSPDHHARRPMNAFLIFCKKHRPIVREKYPNLENRAITKILGDWWANLENKDQDPFKSLASNYKDAFLSANPNFKWYKLPAPPLRTLSTRPTNSERSYGDLLINGLGSKSPAKGTRSEDDVEQVAEYPTVHVARRRGLKNNMPFFKLADENQMGGLSNLIGGTGLIVKMNDNNNNNMVGQEPASDDDLIIDESAAAEEPFANMRTHAARMLVTPKRKLDVHSEFQAMKRAKKRADYLESAVAASAVNQEPIPMAGQKSSRACKGKKYLEFIKQNKTVPASTVAPVSSASKVLNDLGSQERFDEVKLTHEMTRMPRQQQHPLVVQAIGFPHNGYCKPQPTEVQVRHVLVKAHKTTRDVGSTGTKSETEGHRAKEEKLEPNNGKLFDASDFELDSKIIALPALSLDTYLMRKRETKKKKKIGKGKSHARKQANVGPTIQEAKEAMQKSVGSQKRKARKESITRRDVNSVTGSASVPINEDADVTGNASDLLILATLAAGEIETHQQ